MITTPAKTATTAQAWRDRVEAADWGAVGAELDAYGCALTGPPLTPPEATLIAALYPDDSQFRSTVNMARLRFGEGEYRYFAKPFPDAVVALKPALYPLPIARECWTRLGRDTAWPGRQSQRPTSGQGTQTQSRPGDAPRRPLPSRTAHHR